MEWISNVLVLEKLVIIENKKDEKLKTAQTKVIKFMYHGHM
jgi:hypothetical protein